MDPALLPAVEQLVLLRRGEISPVELLELTLARVDAFDPGLRAFVDFDANRARSQASSAFARGGVLAGLPITVKSCIEVADHRCEVGSTLRRGETATCDAEAVRRLRAAGAVILGTTNCPEFLMAYESDNVLFGPTSNPWSVARSAGGSSGGEAAAIAAGMSAGGLGSDSGGSVREPAHFCGICALKPTPGRVPTAGHVPPCVGPFSSLGAIGPMARTIADVELLFSVLCGEGRGDAAGAPVPYRPMTLEQAKGASVAWFDDDGITPVTAETREAVRQAARALKRAGFHVQALRPAWLEEARRLWHIFFVQCGAMFYEHTIAGRRELLSPIFADFLRTAEAQRPLTAEELLRAWAETDRLREQFVTAMRAHPLLLMPVCAVPAFKHGERAWTIADKPVTYWDAMRYTQWWNLLALPAAVVPVGSAAADDAPEGLPIGVQIAGRPYEDELVLAAARVLDRAFGYRVPPLARRAEGTDRLGARV